MGGHDLQENGKDWCAFLLADPQQGLLIWVGERDDIRQDLIQRIVRHTLWPTLIGVTLLVLLTWLVIGWGLAPLRAMAPIEPHLLSPRMSRIDLCALVREELAELAPLALEKEVELVLEGSEDCQLETDPAALAIALQNLLTNALNFSPVGSEVRVGVHLQADGAIQLSVEDAGPGIDEQHRERLLERFYSQGNAQGAGLGLAIMQMIAGKIGCRLDLHNRPEGGLRALLQFKPALQPAA